MTLSQELSQLNSIFFDTAPIIYYIEAHPQFGPLTREAVQVFQSGNLIAYSSVITLAEVLGKPIQAGKEALARRLQTFCVGERISTLLRFPPISLKGQEGFGANMPA